RVGLRNRRVVGGTATVHSGGRRRVPLAGQAPPSSPNGTALPGGARRLDRCRTAPATSRSLVPRAGCHRGSSAGGRRRQRRRYRGGDRERCLGGQRSRATSIQLCPLAHGARPCARGWGSAGSSEERRGGKEREVVGAAGDVGR